MLYYLRNIIGFRLTEEQLLDIGSPSCELLVHVTTKFAQVGSLLGLGVVGPVWHLFSNDGRPLSAHCLRAGTVGVQSALLFGPLSVAIRIFTTCPEAIFDRAYQIRYNQHVVRMDRAGLWAAAGGFAIGWALEHRAWRAGDACEDRRLTSGLHGALVGFSLASFAAGLMSLMFMERFP